MEESILALNKHIGEIEVEIEKLYEKHNVSKEKADFIEECDAIASVLNQFVVRLRKNKVHLLQEKTFEMYRLLSSRSGVIKDITIDDKTYEVRITDRNGHEIQSQHCRRVKRKCSQCRCYGGCADQRAEAADHHRHAVVAPGQHAPRQHREQLLPECR